MAGSDANNVACKPLATFIPFKAFSGRRRSSSERRSKAGPVSWRLGDRQEKNAVVTAREIYTNGLIHKGAFILGDFGFMLSVILTIYCQKKADVSRKCIFYSVTR